jgi:cobyrinic acid a,c-diamide synthase
MDGLARGAGLSVQHFLSRACFAACDAARSITGQTSRHLDSWLMSREVCCELFAHAARSADLAMVEGVFDPPWCPEAPSASLDVLCDWLDLPRVAVVAAPSFGHCRMPPRPDRLDGVLIDDCTDQGDFRRVQTLVESLWGVPVFGGLPAARRQREELAALPCGSEPPRRLTIELGEQFAMFSQPERLRALALRREFREPPARLFRAESGQTPLKVAVAFDAAFRCYFPDTLDLLELRGAEVVDFSPMRDEELPAGTDIVYLGCGHPERFAAELTSNHCMALALRHHVCSGRRLYAEGGGLAYLCEHIVLPDGAMLPMAGVLPASARMSAQPAPPVALEATLSAPLWLGRPGTPLRGYRSGVWRFAPGPGAHPCIAEPGRASELIARHHAVGSGLHLNFAAQPGLFQSFLRAHSPCLEWGLPRGTTGGPIVA